MPWSTKDCNLTTGVMAIAKDIDWDAKNKFYYYT